MTTKIGLPVNLFAEARATVADGRRSFDLGVHCDRSSRANEQRAAAYDRERLRCGAASSETAPRVSERASRMQRPISSGSAIAVVS